MIFQLFKSLFSFDFRRYFKIKRKLGEGGFGKVYLVARKADSRLLAVKKLDKSKISHLAQTKTQGLIPLEIYCLNGLRHKNIVQVHGYVGTRYNWYLVMEYNPASVDLFDYILKHGPLPEQLSRDIFLQLYSALSYCLSVGVDHRDIKDENILIDTITLQISLIDFGSATLYKKNVPYTYGRGTTLFLPPEFYKTGSYLALDATTWALGCLVYKMLTGYHPFLNRGEVLKYNPRFRKAGVLGKDLMRQCLAKDPKDRMHFDRLGGHPWCSADLHEIPF